jgi:hypothetical protein
MYTSLYHVPLGCLRDAAILAVPALRLKRVRAREALHMMAFVRCGMDDWDWRDR